MFKGDARSTHVCLRWGFAYCDMQAELNIEAFDSGWMVVKNKDTWKNSR